MDGFNIIPVEKDLLLKDSVEVIDEEKEKKAKQEEVKTGNMFLFVALLILILVLGYLLFLIFYRISLVGQIINYADQLQGVTKNIDLKEIQEYQAMDTTLKSINGKLNKHILTSEVAYLLNQNLRKTLQITEYRMDVKQVDVEVGITAVAPTFRELAEQTEKLFSLREQGVIQSFTVTSLSFESDTKRVKFTMRIILDKTKTNAVAISQKTNNI